jgi:tetratricopeptide (TPR) repeat protein
MAASTRQIDLVNFARLFAAQAPWVLFVGSPISVAEPTCVPGVPAIIDALLGELGKGEEASVPGASRLLRDGAAALARDDRKRLLGDNRRVPFEVILSEIANHTGDFVPRFVQEMVRSRQDALPNANHLAISRLVDVGLVDLVVTTNFDESLEATACRLSVSIPLGSEREVPGSPGLLKLHGTISRPETMAIDPESLARRDQPDWREFVADQLRGRNILFVGYGFNDPFDIAPALLLAAQSERTQFYWACQLPDLDRLPRVTLAGVILHDLYNSAGNLLNVLARETAAVAIPPDPEGTEGATQEAEAAEAISRAIASRQISVSEKLAALAALFYWTEDGEAALQYFRVASECPGSRIDNHILARASMRARRFRQATRYFDRMLATELPVMGADARVRAEIDWSVAAGFCSSTGGRRRDAGRYYLRARRAFNRSGLSVSDLGPYLADQLLRSQAGHEIGKARFSVDRSRRELRLRRAERYLNVLEKLDLALATRPLLALDRARIALARGDSKEALSKIAVARTRIQHLRDPHAVSVCDRLTAMAARDRRALVEAGRRARTEGRMLEWAKIGFEYFGFDGNGPLAPWERAIRNRALASWDLAKDILDPMEGGRRLTSVQQGVESSALRRRRACGSIRPH